MRSGDPIEIPSKKKKRSTVDLTVFGNIRYYTYYFESKEEDLKFLSSISGTHKTVFNPALYADLNFPKISDLMTLRTGIVLSMMRFDKVSTYTDPNDNSFNYELKIDLNSVKIPVLLKIPGSGFKGFYVFSGMNLNFYPIKKMELYTSGENSFVNRTEDLLSYKRIFEHSYLIGVAYERSFGEKGALILETGYERGTGTINNDLLKYQTTNIFLNIGYKI
jgi:hypothetical protein